MSLNWGLSYQLRGGLAFPQYTSYEGDTGVERQNSSVFKLRFELPTERRGGLAFPQYTSYEGDTDVRRQKTQVPLNWGLIYKQYTLKPGDTHVTWKSWKLDKLKNLTTQECWLMRGGCLPAIYIVAGWNWCDVERQNSSAFRLSLNLEQLNILGLKIMWIRKTASKTKLPATGLLKLGTFGIFAKPKLGLNDDWLCLLIVWYASSYHFWTQIFFWHVVAGGMTLEGGWSPLTFTKIVEKVKFLFL